MKLRFLFAAVACLVTFSSPAFAGVTFTSKTSVPVKPPVKPAPATAAPKTPALTPPVSSVARLPITTPAVSSTVNSKAVVKGSSSVDGKTAGVKKNRVARTASTPSAPRVVSQASLDYMREITAALAAGSTQ